jgi:nucleotide-binding universal stress UspA family protein
MLFKRILVPVDFSRRSRAALAYAVGLAQGSDASIDVLHVLPAPSGLSVAFDAYSGRPLPHPAAGAIVDARDQMESLFSSVNHGGLHLRQKIEIGDPAATIVRIAVEDADDLIVIGTHGRTGITGFVLGSVAKTLLGCAPCPVVTLREAQ